MRPHEVAVRFPKTFTFLILATSLVFDTPARAEQKPFTQEQVSKSAHFLTAGACLQARIFGTARWGETKQNEKVDHLHNSPVKRRGLVSCPQDRAWLSWGVYYLEDISMLAMDRMP